MGHVPVCDECRKELIWRISPPALMTSSVTSFWRRGKSQSPPQISKHLIRFIINLDIPEFLGPRMRKTSPTGQVGSVNDAFEIRPSSAPDNAGDKLPHSSRSSASHACNIIMITTVAVCTTTGRRLLHIVHRTRGFLVLVVLVETTDTTHTIAVVRIVARVVDVLLGGILGHVLYSRALA